MSNSGSQLVTKPLAILGAGSWGTALAIQFARTGHTTHLWGRNTAHQSLMAKQGHNSIYLPNAMFPPTLQIIKDLKDAIKDTNEIIIAIPSYGLRAFLMELKPLLAPHVRLAWASKGFEIGTGLLPHQVVCDVLGNSRPFAVLSGPTFAREVGAGLPTALTIASPDENFAKALASHLSSANFRAYTSKDIIGIEVGGAIKNVLAVGAGLSDGLKFGANTRVALITRGLAEMTRLGVALGAHKDTFMGLAGLGDLVLTCTDDQSRNRRFGLLLAAGYSIDKALKEIGQIVEGYTTAKAVQDLRIIENVNMPICAGIYQALYENLPVQEVVNSLMTRPIKMEFD